MRRAPDDTEHIIDCCLIVQDVLEFASTRLLSLEEPRVLDGDHGLCGKILDQLDLPVGKQPHLLAYDRESTDQLIVLEHRDREYGPITGAFGGSDDKRMALEVGLGRPDVGDLNRFLGN